MKYLSSVALCVTLMLSGNVFAQVGGRQGTEIRMGGGGAGGNATNAQPPSIILTNLSQTGAITNIDEGTKLYVRANGSDTTGTRGRLDKPFATPRAAVLASSAGDLIDVGVGVYSTGVTNLLKDKVNWYFAFGAILTNTETARISGIFNNTATGNGGTIRCGIYGKGEFWDAGQFAGNEAAHGVLVVSNATSEIFFQCYKVGNNHSSDTQSACVMVRNCSIVTLDIDWLWGGDDPICLWVGGGIIRGRVGQFTPNLGTCIYGENLRESFLDIDFDSMNASNNMAINWEMIGNTNSLLRIRGGNIRGSFIPVATQPSVLWVQGGRVDIKAQAINNYVSGFGNSLVQQDGGVLNLEVNNPQTTNDMPFFSQTAGYSVLTGIRYEDLGASSQLRPYNFLVTGGTNILNGGYILPKWGSGYKITGGRGEIVNAVIDTSAAGQTTNYPIWKTGGTLLLKNTKLFAPASTDSIFANSAQSVINEGGVTVNSLPNANITQSGPTNNLPFLRIPGIGTNAILISDAAGNVVTGKLSNLTMSPDGTLTATAGAGGTNFDKALVNGIIYSITNAGNNTTVTADWNGPHWMRLQFNGTTTISFTNCPAASPTNGQIYTLELYAPTTVPTLTIQNIDARVINWQGVGSPVLVDGLTNILTVRFDGTNFIGQSHQDRTLGLITTPYLLGSESTSSNHNHKGITSLTNQPGDGSPDLRFRQTNGVSYTELTTPDSWLPTNRIVLGVTNVQAGEILKVLSVSVSGGIATIILTNGLDNGGSGSPGGERLAMQFHDRDDTFAGTTNLIWDPTNNVLWGKTAGNGSTRIRLSDISAPNATNEYGPTYLRMTSSHDLGIGNNNTNNWLFTAAGHFIPFTGIAHDVGDITFPVRNVYSRKDIKVQNLIESDRTLTNIDLSLGDFWANNTNQAVDAMYAITNPVPGEFVFHFIGRTNSAANQTLMFTNAPGVTLNWMGSSTNGPVTLTLFSNSFLKVFGSVSTNSGATNVYLSWLSDSLWPQRNQAIIASAGGSTSNLTVGGMIYYDAGQYTNHSNAQNDTNYAFFMSPANILTNNGDMMIGEWDIQYQVTSDGTNQFFIGFGANTNIFNTGNITNKANASAKLRCEITRTGNSSQHIFAEYKVHGLNNIWYGIATNAETVETCGITNILRMHGRKAGVNTPGNVGNHTNNQFRVWYNPVPR